ncbi:porin family protein [bacterium]|nr:porin family protein [bacterium]MBU1613944.1 porin family protein [bacterium]
MRKWVLLLALFLIGAFASSSEAIEGLVFGVKPGIGVQSSYIGMNRGQFVLLGGLDFARVSGEVTYTETEDGHVVDSEKEDISVRLFIPYGGAKYYLRRGSAREGGVSPYLFGAVFKSLATADLGDAEAEDIVEDILDPWGLIFAGGAEYFFNPSFSVGGEFGIRLLFANAEYSETDEYYDYYDGWIEETEKVELDFGVDVTYTAITLNYWF